MAAQTIPYPPITENSSSYDTRCFTDRYFDTFTHTKNPLTLALRHSNGLYLVRLNPAHEIFEKYEHIELSFQITEKTNRCENKVSGKRKKGGQYIDQTGTVCLLKCKNKSAVEGESDEVKVMKVMSPVKGALFQVNKTLNVEGDQKRALLKDTGFIAIIMPNKRDTAEIQAGLEPV